MTPARTQALGSDGGRQVRKVDVVVVGSGPAGLAAAEQLARAGADQVEVLEREIETGGIPRHSHHLGYGLRDLHRFLTGPAYARTWSRRAADAGVRIRTQTTVTGWGGERTVDVTSPGGLERIEARAVLLATGARERPRAARLVPGSRPAGVLTTGELQQMVYVHAQPVGRVAVVVGAEHVSYSAALTLRHAGVRVAALLTERSRPETFGLFRLGAAVGLRVPVRTSVRVERVVGRSRVEALEVVDARGRRERIPCDTVVFTADWIPDNELARRAQLALDAGTRGPVVDGTFRTDAPGVFAAGNVVHPVQTADLVALDGQHVGRAIADWLQHGEPARGARLTPGDGLVWVSPQRLHPLDTPVRGRVALLADRFERWPRVRVQQGDRTLWAGRLPYVVPTRPASIPASWRKQVDVDGTPVVVSLTNPPGSERALDSGHLEARGGDGVTVRSSNSAGGW